MQVRFDSLGGFVKGIAAEQEDPDAGDQRTRRKLTPEELGFVQLLAFVYALESFLRNGTRAARSAALEFESLGLEGFTVGTTTFTPDNENTRRGEILAEQLKEIVRGTKYGTALEEARSLTTLVRRLLRDVRNG